VNPKVRAGHLGATLVLGAVAFAAPRAGADEPGKEEFSGSVVVGYGHTMGGDQVHGFGGGFRAGYTLSVPVYVGAMGLLYVGSHDPGEPEVKHSTRDVLLEAGYALAAAPIVVRPTFRGGLAWVRTERDVAGGFVSPQLGIGATVLLRVQHVHVGLDLDARSYTRLVDNGDNAYAIVTAGAYALFGGQL
jgi:hypothetical protein